MRRADRLHAVSERLRRAGAHGCTAQRLAAEFEVSVRTIKRDLAALERTGVPIWARPGPGGGYGLASQASMPPVSLTPAQAVALLAAVSAAPAAPYSDLARAGVQKILDVLDPTTRARAALLAERVWVDTPAAPGRAIRSAIEEAMTSQRVVRLGYRDEAGVHTTREVEPVLFAARNGRWYLVGWCRLRNAMRWFVMERIHRATVTAQPCSGHTIDEVGVPPAGATSVYGRRPAVR